MSDVDEVQRPMVGRPTIRRARRSDFMPVMQLIAASGLPVPPPDRAVLRRFRNLVNDLGADLYLAFIDGVLAGLVHVTYARHLTTAAHADLALLLVAEPYRRGGVGRSLLDFVLARARKRGCVALSCRLEAAAAGLLVFFEKAEFVPVGTTYTYRLLTPV